MRHIIALAVIAALTGCSSLKPSFDLTDGKIAGLMPDTMAAGLLDYAGQGQAAKQVRAIGQMAELWQQVDSNAILRVAFMRVSTGEVIAPGDLIVRANLEMRRPVAMPVPSFGRATISLASPTGETPAPAALPPTAPADSPPVGGLPAVNSTLTEE